MELIKELNHFQLGETLSNEQTSFFNKNGYLHFPGFISKESVENILRAVKEVEQTIFENNIQKINGIPLKFGYNTDDRPIVQRFAFASTFHEDLRNILQDSRLKALLPILGEDGRIGEYEKDGMVINHYINSVHSKFRQMGWHTDGLRDLFYGKKVGPMLNVGLHLDDYPKSNGGLRVLPGTHKQGVFNMLFQKKYFIDNSPDEKEIGFEIKAGDLTVHDGRLWHRVAKSTVTGEKSRRRVIYIPFISGPYQPKNELSKTPLYFKFQQFARF